MGLSSRSGHPLSVASRIAARLPGLATHAIAAALLALLLAAVGQPIFTDDLWWHLALGEARASTGMSLEQDPLLYTAAGPPSSSPWLSQVVLFEHRTSS